MTITFAVDDVRPADSPLPMAATTMADWLGRNVVAGSHAELSLVPDTDELQIAGPPQDGLAPDARHHPNALLQAVHLAFNDHRPLVLSPDTVWIALAQGFARHVLVHSEALRERFVAHKGKRVISVRFDTLDTPEDWSLVMERLADAVEANTRPNVGALMTRPFSTTGPVELAVTRIVLLQSMRNYFDYWAVGICGIPSVTLTGTPEDWRDIQRRVRVFGEYDLGWWAEALDPVLDAFVSTAEGKPDADFWRSIYKPKEAYGTDVITGWLVRLFPYLEDMAGVLERNEAIQPTSSRWVHEGTSPAAIPGSMSNIDIKLESITGARTAVDVWGGLVGVTQNSDGSLEPVAGWAACKPALDWSELEAVCSAVHLDGEDVPELVDALAAADAIARPAPTFMDPYTLEPLSEPHEADLKVAGSARFVLLCERYAALRFADVWLLGQRHQSMVTGPARVEEEWDDPFQPVRRLGLFDDGCELVATTADTLFGMDETPVMGVQPQRPWLTTEVLPVVTDDCFNVFSSVFLRLDWSGAEPRATIVAWTDKELLERLMGGVVPPAALDRRS